MLLLGERFIIIIVPPLGDTTRRRFSLCSQRMEGRSSYAAGVGLFLCLLLSLLRLPATDGKPRSVFSRFFSLSAKLPIFAATGAALTYKASGTKNVVASALEAEERVLDQDVVFDNVSKQFFLVYIVEQVALQIFPSTDHAHAFFAILQ